MSRLIAVTTAIWVFCLVLLTAGVSRAKKVEELTYRYNQIWSSAVRFVRVDNGFPIIEKDKKTGYLLFEYKDAGRSLSGSLELVPVVEHGKRLVKVTVRIQGMPTYVESVMLGGLVKKLKQEFGAPPPARRVAESIDCSKCPSAPPSGDDSAEREEDDEQKTEDDEKVEEDQ